ncbi:hypothetical protein V6N12_017742 [Hibiscus sabdariffa]|uniref:Uncharacterized protein n=1 Tax=Hibiscus sabdariffa TaxID=183260 RepID=A0ABR1ZZJ2_9ROSI
MLKMLIRIHKLQVKTIRSTRNVENVGKGFTSFKSKLVAPPGSFENIGEDSRTETLVMLVRIHELQAETLCSTRKR